MFYAQKQGIPIVLQDALCFTQTSMKHSLATKIRLLFRRCLFGAIIIPYNLLVVTIVSIWLIFNGALFGTKRRLTSKRRFLFRL